MSSVGKFSRGAAWLALSACSGGGGDASPGDAGTSNARCEDPDPGRVTLRRLHRAAYDNTVRDLLDDETQPAQDFPADDVGHGYDHMADVLSLSPVLLEKYERAAERLATEALRVPVFHPYDLVVEGETFRSDAGIPQGRLFLLRSQGAAEGTLDLPMGGRWTLTVRAGCDAAGDEPCRMAVHLDGAEVGRTDVVATRDEMADFAFEVRTEPGPRRLTVEFLNDFFDEGAGAERRDRNLWFDRIDAHGPLDPAPPPPNPTRERLLLCTPSTPEEAPDCARRIFEVLGRRAWRRPLTDEELDRLAAFVDLAAEQGDPFDMGIQLGLQALLLSPHFLFRVELDDDPASPAPHAVDDFALATRLSYFLWSSTPDDTLLDAAEAGLDEAALRAQIERMLADPKARALLDDFAGQWLHLRNLADASPDYDRFPDWDDDLRLAVRAETEPWLSEFLAGDHSMLDLLDARFTWLNDRLAAHYGLAPPGVPVPTSAVRVELEAGAEGEAGARGGLLTHGSILTVTSFRTRTSPVKRGKWVMEQLLCAPPPSPPADIPGLDDQSETGGTLRERLLRHRQDPVCAGCHEIMDNLGFGLERFDAIGAWRDLDHTGGRGAPVDDVGTLPDGTTFHGPAELAALLKDDPAYPACVVQQLFTYALGRAPGGDDACALEDLRAAFEASDHRFPDLVQAVITSPPFRMRRGEPE